MAKILVVDDVKGVSQSLDRVLSRAGHDIETCKDGQEAMDTFSKNTYDLVLTDILMPERDGLELAKFIRDYDDEQKSKTPILAITGGGSLVSSDEAQKAISMYTNNILIKPFDSTMIKAAISECLPANLR